MKRILEAIFTHITLALKELFVIFGAVLKKISKICIYIFKICICIVIACLVVFAIIFCYSKVTQDEPGITESITYSDNESQSSDSLEVFTRSSEAIESADNPIHAVGKVTEAIESINDFFNAVGEIAEAVESVNNSINAAKELAETAEAVNDVFNAVGETAEAIEDLKNTNLEDIMSEETRVRLDSLTRAIAARQEQEAKESKTANASEEPTAKVEKATDKTEVEPSEM
jgi:hypothetical protein